MLLTDLVTELDLLIARWTLARKILASTLPPARSAAQGDAAPASPVLQLVPPGAAEESKPLSPAPEVQITLLQPKRKRQRRSSVRTTAPSRTALNGPVPLGPVAVSPRQLAIAVKRPEQAATKEDGPKNSLDELIAEVSRRAMDQGLAVNL